MYRIHGTESQAEGGDRLGKAQKLAVIGFRSGGRLSPRSRQQSLTERDEGGQHDGSECRLGGHGNFFRPLVWGLVVGVLASIAYISLIAGTHLIIFRQSERLPWFAAMCIVGGAILGLCGGVGFALSLRDRRTSTQDKASTEDVYSTVPDCPSFPPRN